MKIIRPNTRSKVKLQMQGEDYVVTGYQSSLITGGVANFIWEGYLRPCTMTRGRSSVRFIFIDECNREYEMSVNNVMELLYTLGTGDHMFLPHSKGMGIFGLWTFAKEGMNISVVPITQDKEI